MANEKRELATIQKVGKITPIINADRLEVAHVLGWEVVVPKDTLKEDELVVYFEIDSFLPRDKRYEFLESSSLKKHPITDEEGLRIKSIKLRGKISQGLILPVTQFPEIKNPKEGDNVTELLNIKIWDEPEALNIVSGGMKSSFHEVVTKTDEMRAQSNPKLMDALRGKPYYITEKIDGMSVTVVKENDSIRVFSRNQEILESKNNSIWKTLKKKGVIDALEKTDKDIAIQGELFGPKIQSNRLKVKELDYKFFNLVNPENNKRYDYVDWFDILKERGLDKVVQPVKVLEVGENFNYSLEELQELSSGNYDGAGQREGIVIRPLKESEIGDRLSFKVINNDYLLKHGE